MKSAHMSMKVYLLEGFPAMEESQMKADKLCNLSGVQRGPLSVISRVITPFIGFFQPQIPSSKAISMGSNSIYN